VAGGQGTLEGKAAGIRDVHTERKSRVLLNTHKKKKEKGNGQPVWSCPFPFFMQPPYSIGLR
jgi:hypothetical protein